MPTLYILCGIPASGKSTWAHEFLASDTKDTRYVSRDEIRFSMLEEDDDYFAHEKKVFEKFADTIAQTLVDGFDVIADATHVNEYSRTKLTNAIDAYITEYKIIYVVFHTGVEECVRRNSLREGRAHVSEESIRGMRRSFTMPTLRADNRAVEIIPVGTPIDDLYHLLEPYRRT